MKRIVFVGQTPPPYGGQAIMIDKILNGKYEGVTLFHVKMAFSREMDEIGKPSLYKVSHLLSVIGRIFYYRVFKAASILYYPPAGPDKVPIFRDIVILLSTRWMFKRIIFHFHAGGVSRVRFKSPVLNFLFKKSYHGADCSILLSELNPSDGKNLAAKRQVVVPYGIEDAAAGYPVFRDDSVVRILFVGIIKESKGIVVLLNACREMWAKGLKFRLEVMGKFESREFESHIRGMISAHQIEEDVAFLGVLSGKPKLDAFSRANIFCFPTFFESETFGVVLLEAMQFSLPIVSTNWRGIPSIIKDGINGYLVEPKNATTLKEKLEILIADPALRMNMGKQGRNIFLQEYTLQKFHDNMEKIFKTC